MSNGAPVCPISSSQPTAEARRLNGQSSGIDVAHIPPAHHLLSVINSLNIMTNVITQITRGAPQVNNIYPPKEFGYPTLRIQKEPFHYDNLLWQESDRDYTENTVYNPEDPTEFVKIKTLAMVVWNEQTNGSSLVYTKRIE